MSGRGNWEGNWGREGGTKVLGEGELLSGRGARIPRGGTGIGGAQGGF